MSGIRSHGVVVGVNESRGSGAALALAISEAALRGSAVDIITAWSVASRAGNPDDSPELARRSAQQVQDTAVALALSEVDARPVLYRQVVEGEAGEVLSQRREGCRVPRRRRSDEHRTARACRWAAWATTAFATRPAPSWSSPHRRPKQPRPGSLGADMNTHDTPSAGLIRELSQAECAALLRGHGRGAGRHLYP